MLPRLLASLGKIASRAIPQTLGEGAMIVLCVVLLFWRLGVNSLTNWDEAWYADMSRSMYTNRSWLTTYWNKEVHFEKGPLMHWLSVLAFIVTAKWELAVRSVSAVSAVVTVIVTMRLEREIAGKRDAWLPGWILATTPLFLYRSRTGNMDSLATMWIVLAAYGLLRWVNTGRKFPLFLSALAVGLTYLTKTLVVSYVALGGFFYLFSQGLLGRMWEKKRDIVLVAIVMLAFPIFWFVSGYFVNGSEFLVRYTNDIALGKVGGGNDKVNFSLDYLYYLWQGMKVWSIVAFAWVAGCLTRLIRPRDLFAVSFVLPVFVLLAGVSLKADWYLFPLLPFVALMCSEVIRIMKDRLGVVVWLIVMMIGLLQLGRYHLSYWVTDTSHSQAKMSALAGAYVGPNEHVILDDFYFPVAIFYSNRRVLVVRSTTKVGNSMVLTDNEFATEIASVERKIILSRDSRLEFIRSFSQVEPIVLAREGDIVLLEIPKVVSVI